jgi:KUP system potassium uptake protein
MAITSVVFFEVTRRTWRWPLWKSVAALTFFLSFDLPFLAANLLKFSEGGYLPVLVGSVFFVVMVIWRRGRSFLAETLRKDAPRVEAFQADLAAGRVQVLRPRGTAIFMVSQVETVPITLRRHIERIGSLHQNVVLLAVQTEHTPTVSEADRVTVRDCGAGLYEVIQRFGFMEQPNIPEVLQRGMSAANLKLSLSEATYYLGRETFLATSSNQMGAVEESLFAFLSRNAHSASLYFRVPPEQVVEFGIQVDL